jgi:hypothetical protein
VNPSFFALQKVYGIFTGIDHNVIELFKESVAIDMICILAGIERR